MPPRRRPTNEVPVEEVYDHDRMTRLGQRIEAFKQQSQAFFATQHRQNHNPYNLGDDALGGDDFQEVDEDFEETGNNYFELEPLFDISDIEEDDDRLNLGPKFDLSDTEDENEFHECEQNKNFKSCSNFILNDDEVNDEQLKSLFTHSNKESIQEYLQGESHYLWCNMCIMIHIYLMRIHHIRRL